MKTSQALLIIGVSSLVIAWVGYSQINVTHQSSSVGSASEQISTEPMKDWKQYAVNELGLTFKAPNNMTVTSSSPDASVITFYVQRGSMQTGDYYQLYGLYQKDTMVTEQDLENVKDGFESSTIRNSVVDGYIGVGGQLKGERNRFVTYLLKDDHFLILATSQPTQENKSLSDQIISTFNFE